MQKTFIRQLALVIVLGMAFSGCCLVLYGIVSSVMQSTWPPLEKSARWISMVVTLLATIFTALLIYVPRNTRPPMVVSRYFTAPVVIIFGVCGLVYVAWTRALLSEHIVNGFAILGLSGALLRLFPVAEF